jgi:hypothetical protein
MVCPLPTMLDRLFPSTVRVDRYEVPVTIHLLVESRDRAIDFAVLAALIAPVRAEPFCSVAEIVLMPSAGCWTPSTRSTRNEAGPRGG